MKGSTFLIVLCLITATASAAFFQDYGNFTGITIAYKNVNEETYTESAALYGQPTLNGDALEFNNLRMGSYSSGINGSDITDGLLNGIIEAKPTKVINYVRFDEWGDATLTGTGGVGTSAGVANSMFIKITEISDEGVRITLTEPIEITINMAMTSSTGDADWNLRDDGAFRGRIWSGTTLFDAAAALRANGYATASVTKLEFTMDNTLTTSSEVGTSAYIAKKDTNGIRVTSSEEYIPEPQIPEPMTLGLLALGSLALLRRRAA